MLKQNIGVTALTLSALLLAGCSSDSDDNDDPAGTSMPAGGDGGEGEGNGGGSSTLLDGNWTTPCEGEFGSFEITNLMINGSTAIADNFAYTDANCTQPDIPAVTRTTISIAYPGGSTTTAQGEAVHINTTGESLTVDGAELDAAELQLLQTEGFFDVEYDIGLVSGSTLLFGLFTNELDGTTAERRPNTLDPDTAFIRQ